MYQSRCVIGHYTSSKIHPANALLHNFLVFFTSHWGQEGSQQGDSSCRCSSSQGSSCPSLPVKVVGVTLQCTIRVVSRFLSSRFHPKSRWLFPFYFSNITLSTDLLTFGVTGAAFKIAGEMRCLPAYFDNPAQSKGLSSQFEPVISIWYWPMPWMLLVMTEDLLAIEHVFLSASELPLMGMDHTVNPSDRPLPLGIQVF